MEKYFFKLVCVDELNPLEYDVLLDKKFWEFRRCS